MTNLLLLGAGFSKNWNGWVSSELKENLLCHLHNDAEISELLRSARDFEEIIADVRFNTIDGETIQKYLKYMKAIKQSFKEMNDSYKEVSFEFSLDRKFSIRDFLQKFDAIFTLNQDLLLEIHYNSFIRYPYFPGILPPPN